MARLVVITHGRSISVTRKAELSKERDIVPPGWRDFKPVENPVGIR